MIDPKKSRELLREHFDGVNSERFEENVATFCSDFDRAPQSNQPSQPKRRKCKTGQLVLFQSPPTPLPLKAYLACALTGLSKEQRRLMFHLSDIISVICQEQGIELYEPRKKTDPVHHQEVKDAEVFRTDRERVLDSDLLIHLGHYPSTGSGEELDFAYNALLPMVLIFHSEDRISRMITGIPSLKLEIEYQEPEDLRLQLRDRLIQIRPLLEERKLAFSKYEVNLVGDRIRRLREDLALTREEVADKAPLVTAETLEQIEESDDRISNPSLMQLRQIATVLKTTVADLVEPDINERLLAALEGWVTNRSAARFSGIPKKDRNRLIRRLLLRFIDSLEKE